MKVEAHPIPEHMRPRRVVGRVALVGDAAGYVTKCSGEGIYFAAKSGRMAAEEIVALTAGGTRLPTEMEIKDTYLKKFDAAYGPTYLVLDILQKVFYTNNGARARGAGGARPPRKGLPEPSLGPPVGAREAFVDMCASDYVQKVTFDSYLYKKVPPPSLTPAPPPPSSLFPRVLRRCSLLSTPLPLAQPSPASLASQVQGNDPINDIKLLFNTIGSVIKGNAIAKPDRTFSNPVESLKRL